MFKNIPDVTKNLLIINVLMFLATIVLESQGILLRQDFSIYYPSSPFFEPYQLITSMFMHLNLPHLLFNMMGLVFLGSMLERVWGKKRFFIFYFVTGIGAALLHWCTDAYQVYQISGEFFPTAVHSDLEFIKNGIQWKNGNEMTYKLMSFYLRGSLGASGSIYGLLAGFALLFPNTELRLLFPPVTVKAKWLALILVVGSLFLAFSRIPGDNIGHVAHLGGALFGFILIQIWKKDRTNFY
jgi:membrane associated rhomboid family serine protease